MKMRQLMTIMIACAAIGVAGCSGESGGGGGGGSADANNGGGGGGGGGDNDAGGGGGQQDVIIGGDEDTQGGGGGADGGGTDTGGNTCDCTGKQCGFPPGCATSCGTCPIGQTCNANFLCQAGQGGGDKKAFGEPCGANPDCPVPGNGATDGEIQAYRACVNAQCESNLCGALAFGLPPVCLKTCNIEVDKKNNVTGADGVDGIEDPSANSECLGAEDGPAGTTFACIEQASEAQVAGGQSFSVCIHGDAGSDFQPCTSDADCGNGDACNLIIINGGAGQYCLPKLKEADGSEGAKGEDYCNANPASGEVATCENNFCFNPTLGCTQFCDSDADCSENRTCEGRQIFSDLETEFKLCWPKNCELDKDCGSDHYCLINYNGVENPEGDPDPEDPTKVILPGWEHLCVKQPANSVGAGEKCDPFSSDEDSTLPECYAYCEDGYCGGLCNVDADCGASNMKCTISGVPLDLSDPQDDIYDTSITLGICAPFNGADGSCTGTPGCGDGKFCKFGTFATEIPGEATGTTETLITGDGICIDDDPDQQPFGQLCGSDSTAAGLGKLCKSGLCFNFADQDGVPGLCVDTCGSKSDCPASVTVPQIYGGGNYKAICTSSLFTFNSVDKVEDRVYVPYCAFIGEDSSLTDCSATKSCVQSNESCRAFTIASGPEKPTKVEYFCVNNVSQDEQGNPLNPDKKVGEECNPEADFPGCIQGPCLEDSAPGKGYCAGVCNADADCGSSADGMMCDSTNVSIPRLDDANTAYVPLCRKKKSCIPCSNDYQCADNYRCTNIGGTGALANQRCAPPCETDADCGSTDGGAKCEDAKAEDGSALGYKVCTPGC